MPTSLPEALAGVMDVIRERPYFNLIEEQFCIKLIYSSWIDELTSKNHDQRVAFSYASCKTEIYTCFKINKTGVSTSACKAGLSR